MRTTYITIGFIAFALVLSMTVVAMGLPAAAQTSATSSSPQAAPSQTPPQQEPQSAPSQAPQQQPSQSAPAHPPAGQSGAASQSQAPSHSEDDNPLNLTDEQKAKLRPIIADENQQMEAVRNDTTLTTEQKVAKANQIRETASPKIKAILTPEQLQKLADLQQKAREQQQQQQQQQQSAPPNQTQKPQ